MMRIWILPGSNLILFQIQDLQILLNLQLVHRRQQGATMRLVILQTRLSLRIRLQIVIPITLFSEEKMVLVM